MILNCCYSYSGANQISLEDGTSTPGPVWWWWWPGQAAAPDNMTTNNKGRLNLIIHQLTFTPDQNTLCRGVDDEV